MTTTGPAKLLSEVNMMLDLAEEPALTAAGEGQGENSEGAGQVEMEKSVKVNAAVAV